MQEPWKRKKELEHSTQFWFISHFVQLEEHPIHLPPTNWLSPKQLKQPN